MQKVKEFAEERLGDIVKILSVFVLFLALLIIIIIYRTGRDGNLLENEMMEELLLEQNQEEENINNLLELTDEVSVAEVELITNEKIIIDVKGAVEAPGVYEMESDSRVIDCIERAGGFLIDAEQKGVNLAQRTEDQMVIYIPEKGEEVSEFEQLLTTNPASQSGSDNSKIDLNKATKEELQTLNGIGDIKAESIIAYRETTGTFKNTEDIKKVSGIGDATFEKLKEEIYVTP